MELIHFVGRLASVGLQLEGYHSLLLSFILDFYETVNEPVLCIYFNSVNVSVENHAAQHQKADFTLIGQM